MRILIAGLGSIGKRHLRNLMALGHRDLVLLRRSSDPLDEAPHLPVFSDIDLALAQRPDLVIVANPSTLHVETALAAAEAGAHLFIEKPLSNSFARLGELKKLVDEKGLVAMVGFDLHFDEGLNKVRDLVEEGEIGRVLAVQAQVGQYLPDWRPNEDYRDTVTARSDLGGGVIQELCHELDYVAWLVGPPQEVACMAGTVSDLDIDVEDVAIISARFEGGALGFIHLDCIQRRPSRWCKLIGTEGTIELNFLRQKYRIAHADEEAWDEHSYFQERNNRFLDEMKHVVACVRGEEEPRVSIDHGIAAVAVVTAAIAANRSGRTCRVETPLS